MTAPRGRRSGDPRGRGRARWVGAALVAGLAAAGCGDNLPGPSVGPPIEPADTLIVIAHFDDDMIFMQPELRAAIAAGSLTTVYVSSGDQVRGNGRADFLFDAARIVYDSVAGSSDWDCGYLALGDSPVHHCRSAERRLSVIGLDTVDGGLPGELPDSPLHLVEGRVPSIPILGPIGGTATVDSIVASLREILVATQPRQIHALDLAATHGRDHSSHLFSSAFTFWGAAQARYAGAIRWHRGYNVAAEPPTLGDADYEAVKAMVGYYDACYFGWGRCGTSFDRLDIDHDGWLRRQYSSIRAPLEARGALALVDGGGCVALAAGQPVLGDCSAAAAAELTTDGHLRIGDACLASAPGNYQPLAVAPCDDTPSQYWAASDDLLWNGRPPEPIPVMDYDHVRCLAAVAPGRPLIAPVCGEHLQPHWRFTVRP